MLSWRDCARVLTTAMRTWLGLGVRLGLGLGLRFGFGFGFGLGSELTTPMRTDMEEGAASDLDDAEADGPVALGTSCVSSQTLSLRRPQRRHSRCSPSRVLSDDEMTPSAWLGLWG